MTDASAGASVDEQWDGEQTVSETRLHSAVFLRPLAWFLAAFLVRVMDFPVISMLLVIVGLIDVIVRVLERGNTGFALTTYRLSLSFGMFRSERIHLALRSVESIEVSESRAGRLMGYGTVTVAAAGGFKKSFAWVANAKEFATRVEEQRSK